MCIAIMVKKGFQLNEETIDRCWKRNSDGAGVALVKNGKVEIHKGLMTLNDFKDYYAQAVAGGSPSNMLVHFRIRTSGHVDQSNTHPFPIKGGAMIHNGVLFHPEGAKSDTRVVAEKWYNKFNKENLLLCREQLGREVGNYNKFAFLYDDGEFAIVNEQQGNWVEVDDEKQAVWFSNAGWR